MRPAARLSRSAKPRIKMAFDIQRRKANCGKAGQADVLGTGQRFAASQNEQRDRGVEQERTPGRESSLSVPLSSQGGLPGVQLTVFSKSRPNATTFRNKLAAVVGIALASLLLSGPLITGNCLAPARTSWSTGLYLLCPIYDSF